MKKIVFPAMLSLALVSGACDRPRAADAPPLETTIGYLSRPAAARQSQPGRRRFNLGLALVILSSLSMHVVFIILFFLDLAAGYLLILGSGQHLPARGDVPLPLDFGTLATMAVIVVVVMFACGMYQILRILSLPDAPENK